MALTTQQRAWLKKIGYVPSNAQARGPVPDPEPSHGTTVFRKVQSDGEVSGYRPRRRFVQQPGGHSGPVTRRYEQE